MGKVRASALNGVAGLNVHRCHETVEVTTTATGHKSVTGKRCRGPMIFKGKSPKQIIPVATNLDQLLEARAR